MLNQAVINLKTLKRNAIAVKNRLPKNTKFCAVVKANAYGHGAEEVASALYQIADYFAVALLEEGVSLRLSGIDKPILILIPVDSQEIECALRYSLTLTAENVSQLKEIERVAKRVKTKAVVHVKFNSGMNRLGADLTELDKMLEVFKQSKTLVLEGLFSHFSNPESKRSTKKATNKFLLAIKRAKVYNKDVICHISASGGFLRGKYFDMVRVGILLYGYKPFKSSKISVKPVMRVYARVIKTFFLKPFSNCLYGSFRLKRSQTLSLIRYGYADGLNRSKACGQINNRCMDITAIRGKRGERACVMGDAEFIAKQYKTIPYEILSKCANRAQRIYIR